MLLQRRRLFLGLQTVIPVAVLVCIWKYQEVQGRDGWNKSPVLSPFTIVVDGGSTGSRLHVFEQVGDLLERRGSKKATIPLSAFGPTPDEPIVNSTYVAEHLLEAFEYAAIELVPAKYHSETPVYYQATAGMRLLSEAHQTAVYDALYAGLSVSPRFVFSLQRQNIQTLTGELEGLYGVMAANYLTKRVNANLEWMANSTDRKGPNEGTEAPERTAPVGSLDMGGSSTQIVFRPLSDDNMQACTNNADAEQVCLNPDASVGEDGDVLKGDDFFAISYLSYGVDQIRERLWTTWVARHAESLKDAEDDTCDSQIIQNPCAFVDNVQEWQGYTLVGTGDAESCRKEIQHLIAHPSESSQSPDGKTVGGVIHPEVNGKFLAMSMYFYGLDSLRLWSTHSPDAHKVLNNAWPTPTLAELTEALPGLCSRQWDDIRSDKTPHPFTRADILPHRCIESVYMVTLLRDGFGFDPHARDITYTFRVDGSEVEWTLGMVLALNQVNQKPQLGDRLHDTIEMNDPGPGGAFEAMWEASVLNTPGEKQ